MNIEEILTSGSGAGGALQAAGVTEPSEAAGGDFMAFLAGISKKGGMLKEEDMQDALLPVSEALSGDAALDEQAAGALLAGLLFGENAGVDVDLTAALSDESANNVSPILEGGTGSTPPQGLLDALKGEASAPKGEGALMPQVAPEDGQQADTAPKAETGTASMLPDLPPQSEETGGMPEQSARFPLPTAAEQVAGKTEDARVASADQHQEVNPAVELTRASGSKSGSNESGSFEGAFQDASDTLFAGEKSASSRQVQGVQGGTSETEFLQMDAEKVPGRLEKMIRSRIESGGGRMRVQLRPPELGEMHIDVRLKDAAVDVRFEVQSRQAHNILTGNMSQLQELLEEQGYQVDHTEVVLQGGAEDHARNEAQWGGGGASGPAETVDGAEAEEGNEEDVRVLDIEV